MSGGGAKFVKQQQCSIADARSLMLDIKNKNQSRPVQAPMGGRTDIKMHSCFTWTVQTGPGPDGQMDGHKDAQLVFKLSGPEMAGQTVRKKIGHTKASRTRCNSGLKKDKILLAQNYSRTIVP